MRKTEKVISNFYCTKCGLKFPLARKAGKMRKVGHLKKLYCIRCKEEVNFVEVHDEEYNIEEFLASYSNTSYQE